MENFCEFIKGIHTNPFKLVKNLTVREYYDLKAHVDVCDDCATLLDEIKTKYPDDRPNPNFNDGRYN